MRFYYKKACILLLSALLFSISSHAEEAGKPLTAPAEEAPSPENLLLQMSEELKKTGAFQFNAEINFDEVLISGAEVAICRGGRRDGEAPQWHLC